MHSDAVISSASNNMKYQSRFVPDTQPGFMDMSSEKSGEHFFVVFVFLTLLLKKFLIRT